MAWQIQICRQLVQVAKHGTATDFLLQTFGHAIAGNSLCLITLVWAAFHLGIKVPGPCYGCMLTIAHK